MTSLPSSNPPQVTPLTALKFAELTLKAGIPKGVVNVLPGSGMAGDGAQGLLCDVPRHEGGCPGGSAACGSPRLGDSWMGVGERDCRLQLLTARRGC